MTIIYALLSVNANLMFSGLGKRNAGLFMIL